jgi:hypothetical protein
MFYQELLLFKSIINQNSNTAEKLGLIIALKYQNHQNSRRVFIFSNG